MVGFEQLPDSSDSEQNKTNAASCSPSVGPDNAHILADDLIQQTERLETEIQKLTVNLSDSRAHIFSLQPHRAELTRQQAIQVTDPQGLSEDFRLSIVLTVLDLKTAFHRVDRERKRSGTKYAGPIPMQS